MSALIRGTTPVIQFTYSDITVSDIVTAYLTLAQKNTIVVEKDLSSATIGESDLTWKLTQEESLSLAPKVDVTILCDWLLVDGTRGRSKSLTIAVGNPGKNEVIT